MALQIAMLSNRNWPPSISVENHTRDCLSYGSKFLFHKRGWGESHGRSFVINPSIFRASVGICWRQIDARMASEVAPRSNAILLIIANLLVPLSVVVFGIGFFPYKPFLPGLARYETLSFGDPPHAPFDKVVFMVVDALRRSATPAGPDVSVVTH